MKKFIIGAIVGIILATSTHVFASEADKLLHFQDGKKNFHLGYFDNLDKFAVTTDTATDMEISTFGSIRLWADDELIVPDWQYIRNYHTEQTLQEALEELEKRIAELEKKAPRR
ncbi:hypothetical protein [Paenibacillus alkalitolerans]|uniref:hypothetical protein n=1 Tax=Paenibacillus alkalitolerans TaxID=2799335 RepID=UPI0018F60DE3|nr:hypothetical protein [Paenibacillus alkalitolerans]